MKAISLRRGNVVPFSDDIYLEILEIDKPDLNSVDQWELYSGVVNVVIRIPKGSTNVRLNPSFDTKAHIWRLGDPMVLTYQNDLDACIKVYEFDLFCYPEPEKLRSAKFNYKIAAIIARIQPS